MMKTIAIFASGSGSNAKEIILQSKQWKNCGHIIIISDKQNPGVKAVAESLEVPFHFISKQEWENPKELLFVLNNLGVFFIVLAGFLKKIPEEIIEAFPFRIVNIHPSLLPKYGGKGMYGDRVHQAVLDSSDKWSGITIHYVDNQYDNGSVIMQKKTAIDSTETLETLKKKVQKLEHRYFPMIVGKLIHEFL